VDYFVDIAAISHILVGFLALFLAFYVVEHLLGVNACLSILNGR